MTWLLLLPLVWLLIALILGIFVGTCIRVEAGADREQRRCEAPGGRAAGAPAHVTAGAARTSAPVAPWAAELR